ncbi:MAG: hypothetical protein EA343_00425 [Nodularia sp. (in: Bacteria)]|nr:MAG: hypothetical protein EA343_00425 [Nodularia sp. (in: cyanobacteria)]
MKYQSFRFGGLIGCVLGLWGRVSNHRGAEVEHLQTMLPPALPQEFSHAILNILATQQQPISAKAIADILDIDEFTVEEILENWLEFLQRQKTGDETQYQIYHSSFRDWIIKIWS